MRDDIENLESPMFHDRIVSVYAHQSYGIHRSKQTAKKVGCDCSTILESEDNSLKRIFLSEQPSH